MNDRQRLLKRVQTCDFVLTETNLFLDTHPESKPAIEHFNKYNKMRRQAIEEYQMKYGPIDARGYEYGDRFAYVDGPWPWEEEA